MHRNVIKKGSTISLKNAETDEIITLRITSDPLGRGSSCIVYEAETTGKRLSCKYRLKELYPVNITDISRDSENQLLIGESTVCDYKKAEDVFNNALDLLWKFAYSDTTGCYTVTPLGKFEGISSQKCRAVYLITQWMPSDYTDTVNLCGSNDINAAARICRKTTAAAAAFHELGYINLDIKPENILYSPKTDNIMLFDTNTIFRPDDPPLYTVSCSDGAAPEIKNGFIKLYSEKSDVFSIGSMFHRFITGENYFAGQYSLSISQMYSELNKYPMCRNNNPRTAAMIKKVLESCNAGSPNKRCSDDELYNMFSLIEEYTAPNAIYAKNSCITPSAGSEVYSDEAYILHKLLEQMRYVVIQGLHNSGKSAFADFYAHERRSYYHTVIRIGFCGDIRNTIAEIPFAGINDEEYSREKLFEMKYDCLKKYDLQTLLIIDGLNNDDDHLIEILSSLNIRILITSASSLNIDKTHIYKMKAEQELIFSANDVEKFHKNLESSEEKEHAFLFIYSSMFFIFAAVLAVIAFVVRDYSVYGIVPMILCIFGMMLFRSVIFKHSEKIAISAVRRKNCRSHFRSASDFGNAVNNQQLFELTAPDFVSDSEKKRHKSRLVMGTAAILLGVAALLISLAADSFPLLVSICGVILTAVLAADYLNNISITSEMYNKQFGPSDSGIKRTINEIYSFANTAENKRCAPMSAECLRQILYHEYKRQCALWGTADIVSKIFTVMSIAALLLNLFPIPCSGYFHIPKSAADNLPDYICISLFCLISVISVIKSKAFYFGIKDILFTVFAEDSIYMRKKFFDYSEEKLLSEISKARGIYSYAILQFERGIPIYEIEPSERPTFRHYCITQNARTAIYFLLLTISALSLAVWHFQCKSAFLPILCLSLLFQLWWYISGSVIHNMKLLKIKR